MSRIDNLVAQKKYKEAVEVVESIDWRRVKNVHNLCVVGEIYAANKRYEESKEIFLLAYHRAPIGKNIFVQADRGIFENAGYRGSGRVL